MVQGDGQGSDVMRVSYGQSGIVALEKLRDCQAVFHTLFSVRIISSYKISETFKFFEFFTNRHECCRNVVVVSEGELWQVTKSPEAMACMWDAVYVNGKSDAEIRDEISVFRKQRFDLESGPLFRVRLFVENEESAILVVVVHHVVADSWSCSILLDEMHRWFSVPESGLRPAFPAIKKPYASYVAWQRDFCQSEAGRQQRNYWINRLSGELPLLTLPVDYRREGLPKFEGAIHFFQIPAAVADQIRMLTQKTSTSVFSFVMSVFALVLHLYSGQGELIIGHPTSGRYRSVAGRSRSDYNDVFSYFINQLLCRIVISDQARFMDLLNQVCNDLIQDMKHQDYPFYCLFQDLELNIRELPLPEVVLNFHKKRNDHRDLSPNLFDCRERFELDFGQLKLESYYVPQQEGGSDLIWEVMESDQGLYCNLKYRTDIFDADTIARMANHIVHVVAQVLDDPLQQISNIQLITPDELKWISTINATAVDYPKTASVPAVFDWISDFQPEHPAVKSSEGIWSYRAIRHWADATAVQLIRAGVRIGDRVGILVPKSVEMVVAMLGVLKAGAAYVSLDADLPLERIQFILSDCAISIVIGQSGVLFNTELGVRMIPVQSFQESEPESLPSVSGGKSCAYIMYTSGTTGQPKGVMISHQNVMRLVKSQAYLPQTNADVVLQAGAVMFDSTPCEVWGALLNGSTLAFIPMETMMCPVRLASALGELQVTTAAFAAGFFAQIMRISDAPFAQLKRLLVVGDVMPTAEINRLRVRYPQLTILNAYGPTENTTASTTYTVSGYDYEDVPIGTPISNSTAYVVDAQMRLLPVGAAGELVVGGDGVALGYLNQPELTQNRFIPDCFGEDREGRLYRTGDRARWLKDGNLQFLGRLDNQVKIRGYRIELGEIETRLTRIAGIKAAVVLAKPGGVTGEKELWAYILGQEAVSEGAIKAELSRQLPDYMVPVHWVFLSEYPLDGSGKIDRKALREIQEVPPPVEEGNAGMDWVDVVRTVWQTVLNVAYCGLDETFFDLGGHSLLVMELHAQLKQRLGLSFEVTVLFQYPTIRSFVAYVEPLLNAAGESLAADPAEAEYSETAIAIIGMSGRFPGAGSVEEFWQNLVNAKEVMSRFSSDEIPVHQHGAQGSDSFIPVKGVIPHADEFDAALFGFSPKDAVLTDPQQRVLLECALEALEHAGINPDNTPHVVGVFASAGFNSYLYRYLAPHINLDSEELYPMVIGNDKDFLATRIAFKLNLMGPAQTIQTACSSSLVAVHHACESLRRQECGVAIAGGVAITWPEKAGYLVQSGGIGSPDGECRAFSSDANGTVPGNGAGLVVLKRLVAAVRDGDTIYAVIKGSAINNDGSQKVGFTAPSAMGQLQVIKKALHYAEVSPDSISYIEAHGTGTALGDPIEMSALIQAYQQEGATLQPCAIGSVKTNVGHLDAAAGVTGLIKSALCLYHQTLVPSLHFKSPNPHIAFQNSRFYVNTQVTPWNLPMGQSVNALRRAAVSAFGIGGTNVHMILEQAPKIPVPQSVMRPSQIMVVSSRTANGLTQQKMRVDQWRSAHPDVALADAAYTLATGRMRRAVCAFAVTDPALWSSGTRLNWVDVPVQEKGVVKPLIWLFPGQGSQYLGMGKQLYAHEPVYRNTIDYCAEKLKPVIGSDLRSLLYPPSIPAAEDLARQLLQTTQYLQPAVFAVSMAVAKVWQAWGIEPDMVMGHSLGEFNAAVIAGVMDLDEALHAVGQRALLLQAQPEGAMLAVRLSPERLQVMLPETIVIAAVNGLEDCVVSGSAAAISVLASLLDNQGIISARLAVSHAFHSPAMAAAGPHFRAEMARLNLKVAKIPIFSTLTGNLLPPEAMTHPDYWVRQITEPVQFYKAVESAGRKAGLWMEVGPGTVLTRLVAGNGQASENQVLHSLPHLSDSRSEFAVMLQSLGMLWGHGRNIDFSGFYRDQVRTKVAMPTYAFERQRYFYQAKSATPAQTDSETDKLETGLYRPVFRVSEIAASASVVRNQIWVVFSDGSAHIQLLMQEMTRKGHRIVCVERGRSFIPISSSHFMVNPDRIHDFQAMAVALHERGIRPDHVLHAWLLAPVSNGPDPVCMHQLHNQGFYSLVYVVQHLFPIASPAVSLTLLTSQLCDVSGSGHVCPDKALVFGIIHTLGYEYPGVRGRVLDLEGVSVEQMSEILPDIENTQGESVCAWRFHTRFVQSFEALPASSAGRCLRQHGVLVITGGLGGIGLEIAEHVAKAGSARLALISRSVLPERQDWPAVCAGSDAALAGKLRRIQHIESLGAEVIVCAADVADCYQLNAAFQHIEQKWGAIHAVIHAAGLPGSGAITSLHSSHSHGVWAPKLQGTVNVVAYFQTKPLDWMLTFSSLSAFSGGAELADYAAANAWLDAYVQSAASASRFPIQTINWPGWSDVGMGVAALSESERKALKRSPHANLLDSQTGVRLFDACCGYLGLSQVVVSPQNLNKWLSSVQPKMPILDPAVTDVSPEVDQSPTTAVLEGLKQDWCRLLGVANVMASDDFFALGGHSLLALQLVIRANQAWQVRLQLQDVYRNSSLQSLADYIEKMRQNLEQSNTSLLVPLRVGKGAISLFLFHPIGGHVMFYHELVQKLHPQVTVYGIRASGFEESEPVLESVAEMASCYKKLILASQPTGHYVLAGASFGGTLAFETAQQLRNMGRSVELIALMDTPGVNNLPRDFEDMDRLLQYIVNDWFPVSPGAIAAHESRDEKYEFLLSEGRKFGFFDAAATTALIDRMVRVFEGNMRAMRSYEPAGYDGEVLFLKAMYKRDIDPENPEKAWLPYARCGMDIRVVPGDHISMHRDPNVGAMADILNQRLSTLLADFLENCRNTE